MPIDTIKVTKNVLQETSPGVFTSVKDPVEEVSPGHFRIFVNIQFLDGGTVVFNRNSPIEYYDKAGKAIDDIKIRKLVKDWIAKYEREKAFSAKPGLAAAITQLETDIRSDNGVS